MPSQGERPLCGSCSGEDFRVISRLPSRWFDNGVVSPRAWWESRYDTAAPPSGELVPSRSLNRGNPSASHSTGFVTRANRTGAAAAPAGLPAPGPRTAASARAISATSAAEFTQNGSPCTSRVPPSSVRKRTHTVAAPHTTCAAVSTTFPATW